MGFVDGVKIGGNMFKKRVDAIQFDGTWRLIGLPLLIATLISVFLPVLTEKLTVFIPKVHPTFMVNISSAIGMILNVAITLFIMCKFSKLSLADLGFEKEGAISKSIIGMISGGLALVAVATIISLLGGINITYNFKPEYVVTIISGIVLFAFQGTSEEIVFRGYLMPHFAKKWGIVVSMLVSSVLFTLIHSLNPGMTLMPIVNLMVASIVFSLIYYNWGNMFLVGLAHGAWNFTQGLIYGSMVSGNALDGSIMLSSPSDGMAFISGGNFGLEGSIVTTVVGLILIILLGLRAKKKMAVTE